MKNGCHVSRRLFCKGVTAFFSLKKRGRYHKYARRHILVLNSHRREVMPYVSDKAKTCAWHWRSLFWRGDIALIYYAGIYSGVFGGGGAYRRGYSSFGKT